jgi:hypothetical protein
MANLPKKEAPTEEIVRAEAKTFAEKPKLPVQPATKSKKAFVDDQVVDIAVTEKYPRSQQSENYRVEVLAPMTGVPMVRLAPVGWVGPAPLQIPEIRLDEVIQLLTSVR